MLRNVYGLDLGTYEIKVYDKKKNTIWKEKNVVAVMDNKKIISVGDEAYEMFERAPGNIQVVFPMQAGVISHFNDMQYLLQNILKKERRFARGSEYLVAVPTSAAIHIQNKAPGPPATIAVATPTIFPVPIVAESAVHNAAKLDTSPSVPLFSFAIRFRIACGSFVI